MDDDHPEEIRAHEAIWKKLYDSVDVVFSEMLEQGRQRRTDAFTRTCLDLPNGH